MRPLRLELQGFTSFRDRTEIDFSDCELFALVGPTGSGKSTVIDAICFVLYGSVPRYDHKGLVAPVISHGKLEAKVRLDFALGEREYSAVRVVRQISKGNATTKEAVLECGGE
ncbi:MAG: AAA family ATPase, partial [Actinomycetota bacterium]|nr:AAA family ATPase [Actinomycetota bacterium]